MQVTELPTSDAPLWIRVLGLQVHGSPYIVDRYGLPLALPRIALDLDFEFDGRPRTLHLIGNAQTHQFDGRAVHRAQEGGQLPRPAHLWRELLEFRARNGRAAGSWVRYDVARLAFYD